MSDYLERVKTDQEFDHGYYKTRKPDQEIINDLVNTVNKLVAYIGNRDNLKSGYSGSFELPVQPQQPKEKGA